MNKLIILITLLITNLTFAQEDVKLPYKPDGLDINYANWNWSNYNLKEFVDFQVTLSNKTNENFEMVRYRVKIWAIENGRKREVFSKSYIYDETLNAGDVIRIPVNDLIGFDMGVNVSIGSNFSWTG